MLGIKPCQKWSSILLSLKHGCYSSKSCGTNPHKVVVWNILRKGLLEFYRVTKCQGDNEKHLVGDMVMLHSLPSWWTVSQKDALSSYSPWQGVHNIHFTWWEVKCLQFGFRLNSFSILSTKLNFFMNTWNIQSLISSWKSQCRLEPAGKNLLLTG